MILAIGNIKGGVGKTTLAVNFAIDRGMNEGESVVLVDADEQGTASLFTEIREQDVQDVSHYTCVKLHGAQVRSQGLALADKFDQTIIDCGGRNTEALRAALIICDVLLIPLAPRSFDFWSMTQMSRLLDEVAAIRDLPKVYALVNLADPVGADNKEALEALAEYPQIEVLENIVVRRKAWPNAASNGRAVFEHVPEDKKASDEYFTMAKRIYS